MLLLIIISLIMISLQIYFCFLFYRKRKGVFSEGKYDKASNTICVMMLVLSLALSITFILNFKVATIIITASTFMICFIIDAIFGGYSSSNEKKAGNCMTIILVGTCITAAVFGTYYLGSKNMDKFNLEVKEIGRSEQIEIITEKRNIDFGKEGKTDTECFFAILTGDDTKKYSFFINPMESRINEEETQLILDTSEIKLNYIPEGQEPYCIKVDYEYHYVHKKDPLLHRIKDVTVYEVYISENDVGKYFIKNGS